MRGLAESRKRVGPKPRRYGTSTRYPALTRGGVTLSHAWTSSGKPCKRTIGNPRGSPLSSYPTLRMAVSTDFAAAAGLIWRQAPARAATPEDVRKERRLNRTFFKTTPPKPRLLQFLSRSGKFSRRFSTFGWAT